MPDLLGLFLEMVRIDSESGDEARFLAYLDDLLAREFGIECHRDEYGNLTAQLPGLHSRSGHTVLFGAHADTVKPGKGIDPVVIDGVVRSRGETVLGADDKAGIAELIEALRTATRRPPVDIVITREEELGVRGARHVDTGRLRAKIGFVLDMDLLDTVVVGGPSKLAFDVEIVGRAAHAAMEPEKGISAIRAAVNAIARLHEGRIDEQTTLNVGTIHGGEIRNGVPERAVVQLECRSLSHAECLRQGELVRQAFEAAGAAIGATVHIESELAYRASQVKQDALVIRTAEAAIRSVGLTPRVRTIVGGTDASAYNAAGIETVVLGVGVRNEHSKEEEIAVADMETAVSILRMILETLAES